MSQINHNECWVRAGDPPQTARRVIIWTKKPWLPQSVVGVSVHLDLGGAWYSPKERLWYHSDGSTAENVTHWMEIPRKPES